MTLADLRVNSDTGRLVETLHGKTEQVFVLFCLVVVAVTPSW